ncbi:hypothetical protein ACFQ1M_01425 [Sungkyunkwania multivorans]|uniref:DUF4129 domain-containing protein n=1 Tax=Sungkyunkwania multivorans TaxID=1173618 RepID=A0ABW3CW84_9FLAO
MKRFALIFILSLSMLCESVASAYAQEVVDPNTEAHKFDKGFQDQYKGRKFNYEGRAVKTSDKGNTSGKNSKYSKDKPSKRDTDDINSSNTSIALPSGPFFFVLMIIVAAALIFLVHALITQGNGRLFGNSSKKILDDSETISAENIHTTDIDSLIVQAEKSGDYRLATRYLYLSVLKRLAFKKLIEFEEEKTNSDYLLELEGHQMNPLFRKTSYLYNYIWYGEFSVDDLQYAKVKRNFGNLLNQIT